MSLLNGERYLRRVSSSGDVLVSLGCHNKILWARKLKQPESIFLKFWRLRVVAYGLAGWVFGETSFPGL